MTKLEISVKTRALRHELNRVSTFKVNRFAQVCTVQANEETHVFKKTRDLRQSLISVACARTMLSQIYFRNLANTLTSPVSLPLVFLSRFTSEWPTPWYWEERFSFHYLRRIQSKTVFLLPPFTQSTLVSYIFMCVGPKPGKPFSDPASKIRIRFQTWPRKILLGLRMHHLV